MGFNHRIPDYPFTMQQVVDLMKKELEIRRESSSQIYADCPWCNNGRRGKLNINLENYTYRCCYNHDHSGGLLDLWIEYQSLCGHFLADYKEAYRDLCDRLRVGKYSDSTLRKKPQKAGNRKKKQAVLLADANTIDQTYRSLLSLLRLNNEHRKKLSNVRCLPHQYIDQYCFRSTPAFDYRGIAQELLAQDCTLKGVPGFYKTGNGSWSVNFSPYSTGILIPYTDLEGRIRGFQIGLDRPIEDTKYYWFASTFQKDGVSPGAPYHYIGEPRPYGVIIVEGALKAYICHMLTGRNYAAFAGTPSEGAMTSLFEGLKQRGTVHVCEAYDMDKKVNIGVHRNVKSILEVAKYYGFQRHRLLWDPHHDHRGRMSLKGYDDFLLKKPQVYVA